MNLEKLPEDCIVHVFSRTSPRDVCRSSVVSSMVREVAESNTLWESFLPSDYKDIVSRLVSRIEFTSKKDLYIKLSCPRLIDGGKKIFSIDKFTNKKCYMLSARELFITWSSNPFCWCWKSIHESRFPEVAQLVMVCWLEIHGSMNTKILSPNTIYGVYVVVKFPNRGYGLDYLPSEVFVEVGDYKSCGIIYLRHNYVIAHARKSVRGMNSIGALRMTTTEGRENEIRKRIDGWMEIELGEFYCDGSDKEVMMGLREIKGVHLKGGLIVQGIELRPKY